MTELPSPDGYAVLDTQEAGGRAMRGSVIRMLAFSGSLLLGLVSAPLVVRHLGEDFGRYSSVLAVIAIVGGLTEGGLNTIAMRKLAAASSRAERDDLMRDLLGLRLVLSLVGIAIAVAFSAVAGYGHTLVLGTAVAGVGMLLTVFQTLIGSVLLTSLRFGVAAAIEFARGLATAGLIVLLVVLDADVLAFLSVVVPAALIALVLTAVVARDATVLRPSFAPARWGPMLRETAVFAVAVAVNSLYFRLTLVAMSLVATAPETVSFAVSLRVIEVLIGVPAILTGAAFPIISRAAQNDRARFENASARVFELSLLTGTLMSLGLSLSAPFVVGVLTGDPHSPAIGVLQLQSIALTASFVATATGFSLLGLDRYRETLAANVLSLVAVTVLALALTPRFGAEGGAVAAVVADLILCSANTALLMRDGGPTLPLGAVGVAALAAGAGYGAGRLVGVHPLVEAAAGGLVFLAVLALLGRFPPEARELVRRRVAPAPQRV